jgi:hypothetical protein
VEHGRWRRRPHYRRVRPTLLPGDEGSPSTLDRTGPFDAWWNRSIIRDHAGADFSRRELTLALANQDGGAHVDPELDEAYEALSWSNSLGWMAGVPSRAGNSEADSISMGSPVPANVRQIAWELEQSLMDKLAEHLEFLPVI